MGKDSEDVNWFDTDAVIDIVRKYVDNVDTPDVDFLSHLWVYEDCCRKRTFLFGYRF